VDLNGDGPDQALPAILAAAHLPTEVTAVERLRGGSKKGVFRVGLAGGGSVVLYLWHDTEDWWREVREGQPHPDDPFGDASGLARFAAGHRQLTEAGVPVPRVLLLDGSRRRLPADVAVVQDVRGGSLEALMTSDPVAAQPVLRRLGESLQRLAGRRFTGYGTVLDDGHPKTLSLPEVVLQRALGHLEAVAGREPRIGAVAAPLRESLLRRAAAVRPRAQYALVHGELGPDHVLLDTGGRPLLIDIEGLLRADVEWEHAFLELRFGAAYPLLRVPGLDPDRLQLYRLAHYLSLVDGPLRLLQTGFPDRDGMRAIAESNIERALATLRTG
jgi:aminoglycoside phosphotransferase (APT) family kinase protein